jgi:glutaminase
MRAKAPACQGRRRSAIRFGVEPAGLPCKTGVGGGIFSVAPGKMAVVGFSPPFNEAGNCVRA